MIYKDQSGFNRLPGVGGVKPTESTSLIGGIMTKKQDAVRKALNRLRRPEDRALVEKRVRERIAACKRHGVQLYEVETFYLETIESLKLNRNEFLANQAPSKEHIYAARKYDVYTSPRVS